MKRFINYKTRVFMAFSFIILLCILSCNNDDDDIKLIIESISVNEGAEEDLVTITGTGFSATATENDVRFNGSLANVIEASPTSITVEVPFRSTSGNITVTVNNEEAPGPFFNILLPPPTTIAFTSFEEPQGLDVDYIDTGDASTDHYLENNVGQAPVEYISTGNELGFRTFYKSIGSDGITDGDDVGVTTKTSIVGTSAQGGYTDGVQGYYMDDTDGILIIELDPVNIPLQLYSVVRIEMDYLFNDTGWEADDYLKVSVVATSTGETIQLLFLDGDDIDGESDSDLDPEPHIWHNLSGDFSQFRDAGEIQLLVEFKSGSSSAEEVYFDNIKIIGQ